jgi:hypothetical protein
MFADERDTREAHRLLGAMTPQYTCMALPANPQPTPGHKGLQEHVLGVSTDLFGPLTYKRGRRGSDALEGVCARSSKCHRGPSKRSQSATRAASNKHEPT